MTVLVCHAIDRMERLRDGRFEQFLPDLPAQQQQRKKRTQW